MSFATLSRDQEIATLTLRNGKVNALHDAVVDELHEQLKAVEADDSLRAVILTGEGKFFSFGFDIPRFLSYSRKRLQYILKNSAAFAHAFSFFPSRSSRPERPYHRRGLYDCHGV